MSKRTAIPQWPKGQQRIDLDHAARLIQPLLPVVPFARETDGDLRKDLIAVTQAIDVKAEVAAVARSLGVSLIHPVLGIPSAVYCEPDCLIEKEAFEKIVDHFVKVITGTARASAGRTRRGPRPGTLDRYAKSDRALYADFEALIGPTDPVKQKMSRTAASQKLAEDGKIRGSGTIESRAKRFRERYRVEREQSRN